MKKILSYTVMAMMVLSLGGLYSCSEDNDGFTTASENDFPQILQPWFSEWDNGEPTEYKNFSRNTEWVDSVTVTPALYTTVEWFLDGEKINEGTHIRKTLIAGEYILKIVATTTKGLSTSRTGKLIVRALETDPALGNNARERYVAQGASAAISGTNIDNIKSVLIGGIEALDVSVKNGKLHFTVPASLAEGNYKIVLVDAEGQQYGAGVLTINNTPLIVLEEVLWEGEFDVTWGTPFDALKTTMASHCKAGTIVRIYVDGNGQGAATTAWWNNILTGKGDTERGDIMISGSMALEYTLTDFSMELMTAQDGFLVVGDGYKVKKVTVQ